MESATERLLASKRLDLIYCKAGEERLAFKGARSNVPIPCACTATCDASILPDMCFFFGKDSGLGGSRIEIETPPMKLLLSLKGYK